MPRRPGSRPPGPPGSIPTHARAGFDPGVMAVCRCIGSGVCGRTGGRTDRPLWWFRGGLHSAYHADEADIRVRGRVRACVCEAPQGGYRVPVFVLRIPPTDVWWIFRPPSKGKEQRCPDERNASEPVVVPGLLPATGSGAGTAAARSRLRTALWTTSFLSTTAARTIHRTWCGAASRATAGRAAVWRYRG